MATIGSLTVNIGANVSGLDAGLKSASAKLKNFGSQMKNAGTGLTLGLGAPLTGLAITAINSARDFEQSMNLIDANLGATDAQMAALSAQALELGASTSFSAGESASAMLELAKAGMSVEEVGASIAGVMDLAAAGGIELADAATITANAMNAFNLPAEEAAKIANTFAAAANSSSADVADLADGFQMAGAVFASNGMTVDDLAASLAILANNGIAGSDAGTALKTMVMSLAAPTAKAKGIMDGLGLSVYNAEGKMRPFEEIVGQLEESTMGFSDAQRNAAYDTIFGMDAIRAATILTREGVTGFNEMSDAVGRQGAASEAADSRMKGLSGAIEYFKGAVDSVLIEAASPFMTMLDDMIRGAADMVSGLKDLSPETVRWITLVAAAGVIGGPLLMVLGTMATALGGLLTPMGLAIALVAALGLAWVTNFGDIRGKTETAVNAITGALERMWPKVQEVIDAIRDFFAPAVERLKSAFQGLPGQFKEMAPALESARNAMEGFWTAIEPILEAIGAAIAVVIDFGINLLAAAIENLAEIAKPIINQIGLVFETLGKMASGAVQVVTSIINKDWAGAWDGAAQIMEAFGAFVLRTLENLGELLWAFADTIYTAVVNTLEDIGIDVPKHLETLQGAFETAFNALAGFVQPAVDAVVALWDKIIEFKGWLEGLEVPNPFEGWGADQTAPPGTTEPPAGAGPGRWVTNPANGTQIWLEDQSGQSSGGQGMRMPVMDTLPVMGGGAGAGGVTVHLGGVVINNGMDLAEFEWRLKQALRKAGR